MVFKRTIVMALAGVLAGCSLDSQPVPGIVDPLDSDEAAVVATESWSDSGSCTATARVLALVLNWTKPSPA